MSEIEQHRKRLSDIFSSTQPMLLVESLSEADVRAKLIDPILSAGLGWPERLIRREERTDAGEAIDYIASTGARDALIVEAKRAQEPFVLPERTVQKTHRISTLMAADKALKAAIIQVARYCQDELIPYAVLTNGLQILIFKAHRSDIPWMKGKALVFSSPEALLSRFPELWDLLAYSSVSSGSLDLYFNIPDDTPRQFHSPISSKHNPDEILIRNYLNSSLIPLLKAVFDDLTDDQHSEVLKNCYVYSRTLQSVADDFIIAVKDLPPEYLKDRVTHVQPDRFSAGGFQQAIAAMAASHKRGTVLLLLGGVGSGKTTFLRQVRVKYCAKVIEESGAFFYLDFRNAPRQPPFERFVYQALRQQLGDDASFRNLAAKLSSAYTGEGDPLNHPGVLRGLFQPELDRLASLANEMGVTDQASIAQSKLTELQRLSSDDRLVVTRAFRAIEAGGRFILLVFDNADQLDIDYQLQIFLFAENVAAETGANIITALREEKYYLASQQGAFNAFQSQMFHIPSPRLTDLLSLRLRYARDHVGELVTGDPEVVADARDFIDAIWRGGVGAFGRSGSSNVVRLLEHICAGDMRFALKLFRIFVQSGNTNVRKILRIYRDNLPRHRVPYHVPFHEFTKSIMLSDHRYYRESHSDVLNLFLVSGHPPYSHFTACRVLSYLMEFSERYTAHGRGYVEVGEIGADFIRVFSHSEDMRFHIKRCLRSSLIESDTRAYDIDKCRAVRVTPAGEYYLTFLARAFAYIDLVLMDTPISDAPLLARLGELLDSRTKEDRFERVDSFLAYLGREEAREFADFPVLAKVPAWQFAFVPRILEQIAREKERMSRDFYKYSEA